MNWGGSRKGAGRKPSKREEALIRVSFSLPPDCVKWLRAQSKSPGKIIEELIKVSVIQEAQKLEKLLIEKGVVSGKSFSIVNDSHRGKVLGQAVVIPFGEIIEFEDSYYDEDGKSIEEVVNRPEFDGYLISEKVVRDDGVLNPAPLSKVQEFIKEALEILG